MTKEQAIEKAKEQYSEIWDCDLNHPKYEDTVEKIVTGVIRLIMQPTSNDCVSRQAVIKELNDNWLSGTCARRIIDEQINKVKELPPVTPTHGTCKDCKNGFQTSFCSSSVYGCEKHKGVYQYDFYCKDYEKRGNENESIN